MRFGILSVLTTLYFSAVCVVATTCTPESQPNPIAGTKFKLDPITGTANGTLAIVLIPIDEALKIIGSKYTIQTGAYRELVPAMPKDAYPAFLQAAIEHDVQQADGVKLPDFTVRRHDFFANIIDYVPHPSASRSSSLSSPFRPPIPPSSSASSRRSS